ncbi:hypothetical protein ACFL2H_08945 [Planctomycetota bacterium]
MGDKKQAAEELQQVYVGGGADIFVDEKPKYLRFLKSVMVPPVDGW